MHVPEQDTFHNADDTRVGFRRVTKTDLRLQGINVLET